MTAGPFRGLLVPVLTPFTADLTPDIARLASFCRWLLDHGADGLAVFGTTSEANSMAADERITVLDGLIAAGLPADRLMPGTGACAFTEAGKLSRHAVEAGCGGVLVLPPFYYKAVSDDGIFDYYRHLIEQVDRPDLRVYLYHHPKMSATPLSLSLVERLYDAFPDIIAGCKDSSGDIENTKALAQSFPHLSIFPGTESILLDVLPAGAAGCITQTANINPAGIKALLGGWRGADAQPLQAAAYAVRSALAGFSPIPALKVATAIRFQDENWCRVRPPLRLLDDSRRGSLLTALSEAGWAA